MDQMSDIDAKKHRRISLVIYGNRPTLPAFMRGRPGTVRKVDEQTAKAMRSKNTIAPLIEDVTYRRAS